MQHHRLFPSFPRTRESSVFVMACVAAAFRFDWPYVGGVSPPRDEVLLFWQKDPKPLAPGRGRPGAFAPVPNMRAAELASLEQSSPPNRFRDRGAATPAGAGKWRDKIAQSRKGASLLTVRENGLIILVRETFEERGRRWGSFLDILRQTRSRQSPLDRERSKGLF